MERLIELAPHSMNPPTMIGIQWTCGCAWAYDADGMTLGPCTGHGMAQLAELAALIARRLGRMELGAELAEIAAGARGVERA